MKAQSVTKTMMAARMQTSRATLNRLLNRLLDSSDKGLTRTKLASMACVLGVKLNVERVKGRHDDGGTRRTAGASKPGYTRRARRGVI